MKAGRNDPCPCGSGKKYKKCCMEKDLAAEPKMKIAPTKNYRLEESEWDDFENENLSFSEFRDEETGELPYDEAIVKELLEQQISLFEGKKPEPKPKMKPVIPAKDKDIQASNQRWDEFERANYEAKIAIYLKTLNEKELMDDDMAIEMLSRIHDKAIAQNQRDRFDELLDNLQQKLPEIYESSIGYYLKWRVTNAVVAGRHETVNALTNKLTTLAGRDIDIFNQVEDMLAYYGYQSVLCQTLQAGWSAVESSPNIVPWGIEEFAERTANYVIFDYVESHSPIDDKNNVQLTKEISPYVKIVDPFRLTQFIKYISGNIMGQWGPDDFDLRKKGKKADKRAGGAKQSHADGRQNLYDLTLEFLSYLRKKEAIPFTKGDLARKNLYSYFIQRHERELIPQPSRWEQMVNPKASQSKKQPPPIHVLCPDGDTLDVFLSRLLDFLNPQFYKVAATIDLIPSWFRFLKFKNLAEADIIEEAKDDIRLKVVNELKKIWKEYRDDPGLYRGLIENWEQ